MAKRKAEEQLTRDHVDEGDAPLEDYFRGPERAPPEVSAKRKLSPPRRPREQKANPFAGSGKRLPLPQEPMVDSFQVADEARRAALPPRKDPDRLCVHDGYQSKMRALNTRFANNVAMAEKASPFEDWTPMCAKYLSYAKEIGENAKAEMASGKASGKVFENVFDQAKKSEQQSAQEKSEDKSEDKAEEKSQITATGFKFGGAAGPAKTFQFGDKKVEIASQPTSKVTSGFVFNPNGKGEIKTAEDVKKADEKVDEKAGKVSEKVEEKANEDKKAESKPAPFVFGQKPASTTNTNFSFGKELKTDTKPFTFGQVAGKAPTNPSPVFKFGSLVESESKPAFTFGNQEGNKSGSAFGASANPFGSKNAETSPEKAEPSDTEKAEEEPTEEHQETQLATDTPGPGEENEDSLFLKRAKAFELVNGEYKPLGLGVFRVLKHKENGKVRASSRADGSNRVLLNIPVRKEFHYTVVGKGQVKSTDVKPGEDKPTIYLIRVKTEEDGNELKNTLEENKA